MGRYFSHIHYSVSYRIENTYFIEQLKTEADRVQDTLRRLEQEKQNLIKYLGDISTRAYDVMQLEHEYYINIYRYERDRITYEVRVIKQIKGSEKRYSWNNEKQTSIEFHKFAGKERKSALLKAAELSKLYNNCEIIKNF